MEHLQSTLSIVRWKRLKSASGEAGSTAERYAVGLPFLPRRTGRKPERLYRGRRKDGSEFPIEIMLSPLEGAEGILVTAAIRDISVRKTAE